MESKTIIISYEAYQSLLREKLENESFSDVVLRLIRRFRRVLESFGKWYMSEDEEESIRYDLR
ncbi:MAG: antitoxin VapB family protein [Candidatus Helarchaeota archaeon]